MLDIQRGIYQHYKGLYYEVFGVVRHSETREFLVHYRCCYGDWSQWVRPYDMFVGEVTYDAQIVKRFRYTGQTLLELGLLDQSH